MAKASEATLQAIAEGEWTCDKDGAEFQGELADGVPDWTVYDNLGGGGFMLARNLGWYSQSGDADDEAELIALSRAMDAASRTLNDSLQAARNA